MDQVLDSIREFLGDLGLVALIPLGIVLAGAAYLFRRFVKVR